MNDYNYESSVSEMLQVLELDTLENRRSARLCLLYNLINEEIGISVPPSVKLSRRTNVHVMLK